MLALTASATSISMSVIASWQRGGAVPERVVWVAIGVVLTAGAHLLPALSRQWSSRRGSRVSASVTFVIWLACMVTACYGHVTFFLLAQRHAEDGRLAAIVDALPRPPRSMTVIEAELAQVTEKLAFLMARPCQGQCAIWEARQTALVAKQRAIEAESDDVRRWQMERDRTDRQRDRAMTDPVTAPIAQVSGGTVSQVELVTGIGFAVVLECLAGLLWWSVFAEGRAAVVDASPVAPATEDPGPPLDVSQPALDPELDLLSREISAGRLRPTVSEIRQFLRCSQSKAASLRRQLVA
ncbi:MAG: hypothetical protein WDN30_08220 [Pararobbsia sp.]